MDFVRASTVVREGELFYLRKARVGEPPLWFFSFRDSEWKPCKPSQVPGLEDAYKQLVKEWHDDNAPA